MLPGPLRTSVIVAAALATLVAGVWSAFAEVRWPGTSISSAECRCCDYGREDDAGRSAEECEAEDVDDEEDRELTLSFDSSALCPSDVAVAFLVGREHRPHGRVRPVTTLVRGPPTAS